MKDERFLPVEKHEPVEDYDDYTEENAESDELFIGGQTNSERLEHPNSKKANTLYIAS